MLAGTVGFEPTDDGIKTRCLTTWRRPNDKIRAFFIDLFSIDVKYLLFENISLRSTTN